MQMSACSLSVESDNSDEKDSGNKLIGNLVFSIGGSAGVFDSTRADEIADAEEKVHSLYALIFEANETDYEFSTRSAVINDGKDDNQFLRMEKLAIDDNNLEDCYIELPAGYYNICFVANPDDTLLSSLYDLKDNNCSDFINEIVSSTPLDREKGLLMTSQFYGIEIRKAVISNLGRVMMRRAMARIDIDNRTEDITITKATLCNKITSTNLYPIELMPADVTYESDESNNIIEANSKGEAVFYTYENLDPTEPITLTLEYTKEDKNYSHTVTFAKSNGDNISLQRNYLYNVIMREDKGIELTLQVANWDDATLVYEQPLLLIDDGQLMKAYEDAKIGDFMLDDGRIISPDYIQEYHKSKVVGVVALTYNDCPDLWKEGSDSHGGKRHGLVLSARESKNRVDFYTYYGLGNEDTPLQNFEISNRYINNKMFSESLDGYDNWIKMKLFIHSKHEYWNEFPAWNQVKFIRDSNPALTFRTTNWYMPTCRELFEVISCIINNSDSKVTFSETYDGPVDSSLSFNSFFNESWFLNYANGCVKVNTVIDNLFSSVPGIDYDKIVPYNPKDDSAQYNQYYQYSYYWCSTLCGVIDACYLGFHVNGLRFSYDAIGCEMKVRCILAF